MMGGGTFILLKTGCLEPETAIQTEIRLANLLKILAIALDRDQKSLRAGQGRWFCMEWLPQDMANTKESRGCCLDHSLNNKLA
jgi:hypothetical protein